MARAIMIQGTASNVGKSLLVGGLCRIFRQDGYSVAPFKAQNMALNSFITKDGLEMGRAQVMQAECAGKEPDVRMNPILLKPTSDVGSQVIINGEVLGNMPAAEYFSFKKGLVHRIMESYQSLAAENDIIVAEGAGSPAEINLNSGDIVNMGLARMINAPVLLAGDIDRGGVFAALYGTVRLLGDDERGLIKGVIINKFRGDVNILRPGLDMLAELLDVPVIGVVPYLHADIDDEDSLSARLSASGGRGLVDIAVIRLPRISNFTDFNIFEAMDGVSLRYIGSVSEFGSPDVVILPGTKNTMADLKWLRGSGLEREILSHAGNGGAVIGICGGYQMLGAVLKDPYNIEHGGEMAGLGLIECETIFSKEKTRTRVTGKFQRLDGLLKGLTGTGFSGYEIHMGQTVPISDGSNALAAVFEEGSDEPKANGLYSNNIYGTYVHGVFDSGSVAADLVKAVCVEKNVDFGRMRTIDSKAHKEAQYDYLADSLRSVLDMEHIYKILEHGGERI